MATATLQFLIEQHRDPLLPEEPGATAPRARKAGEAAQDPVEDQLRGSVRPAREGPGRAGEVGLAGRTASRAVGQRARERAGGAVERAAAAGRPRVVPDPPGAVPPLPADPELVRLAQVPLPAEIAQRRGPAIAERAG